MMGAPFWLTLAEITSEFGPTIGLMDVAAQRARPFLTFLRRISGYHLTDALNHPILPDMEPPRGREGHEEVTGTAKISAHIPEGHCWHHSTRNE